MKTQRVSGPAQEPMTVAEVRMHLRNPEITSNDSEYVWWIQAAREQVENKLGRALLTQTWDASLDSFPTSTIELPRPPLQSVTSVIYLDADGAAQTLAADQYVVHTTGKIGTVQLAYGATWPSTYGQENAITIRYVAGWTSPAQVPKVITSYMKLLIDAMDKNRSLVTERETFLSPFAERLLDEHRVFYV